VDKTIHVNRKFVGFFDKWEITYDDEVEVTKKNANELEEKDKANVKKNRRPPNIS
jgi:hypothetical protein